MSALDLETARFNMIEQQIRPWDVLDIKVLDTMSQVPREAFVPNGYEALAFSDTEIPIGQGESMMSPKVEGHVLQALDLKSSDNVLEIGTGSGYLTACLASLCSNAYSVECHADLQASAEQRLKSLGFDNVTLWHGDAAHGWQQAPRYYDAIAITGSLPEYDPCFEQQLKPGGRLFVITGDVPAMEATLITRVDERNFVRSTLFETYLKPLSGREKKPAFVF